MDIERALRDLEIAELEEQLARDSLLGCCEAFHPGYTWEPFHAGLCADLDQFEREVEAGLSPRYMIWVPPQHSKSTITSRTFPARLLGRHPDWPIQVSSYAVSLSSEHSRWVRNTMESQRYRNVFPEAMVSDDSAARDFFHTNKGGSLLATGVDGGQTGHPSRVSIIDDPFKNREEADSPVIRAKVRNWYPTSVRTRLADGGGILIFHTRWHQEDLCGWLLDEAKRNPGAEQWRIINYPAIAEQDESFRKKGEPLCPRLHSLRDLQAIRATIPPRDWLALYQQRPVGDEGGYFQKAWMRTYDETPQVGEVYVSADCAYKTGQDNDRTCVLAFGVTKEQDVVILPGITLDRIETDKSVEAMLDLAQRYSARVLCMGRDAYQSIGPFIRKQMQLRKYFVKIEEVPERKDKPSRARSLQARMQQGKVLFPSGVLWDEEIQPEFLAFPGGKHDDSVDAAANAFWLLDELATPSETKPPEPKLDFQRRLSEIRKRTERPSGFAPLFGDGAR